MNVKTKYRCEHCSSLHDRHYSARHCCQPDVAEVLICGACNKEYVEGLENDEAEACCVVKVEKGEFAAGGCFYCNGVVLPEDVRDSKLIGSIVRCRSCILKVAPEVVAA